MNSYRLSAFPSIGIICKTEPTNMAPLISFIVCETKTVKVINEAIKKMNVSKVKDPETLSKLKEYKKMLYTHICRKKYQ